MKNSKENIFCNLPYTRRDLLLSVLDFLKKDKSIKGIYLGGSYLSISFDEKSDIDIFCLIDNIDETVKNLYDIKANIPEIAVLIYQGFYRWTEELYSVFFEKEDYFYIDICLVQYLNSNKFFWEPNGFILYDPERYLEKLSIRKDNTDPFSHLPFIVRNPFSISVITINKIIKNISRKHLWNSIEMISILRRNIMQIIRLDLIKDNAFLGRVDRDIEKCIPYDYLKLLSKTLPQYNETSIAKTTITLINLLCSMKKQFNANEEKINGNWIFGRLERQKIELSNIVL